MKRQDPKKKKKNTHTQKNNKDKEGSRFIIKNSAREKWGRGGEHL